MFPFDPAHLCQRPVSIMKERLLRSEFLAQFDELYTPLKLKPTEIVGNLRPTGSENV